MKPDVKEKWLAALRSGKYRQGTGYLKYQVNDGTIRHCCLGVLCEIAIQEHAILEKFSNEPTDLHFFPIGAANAVLPWSVARWAGLTECNPAVPNHETLASLNDDSDDFDLVIETIEELF